MGEESNYLFLTGKVRAMEKELFDLSRYSRLMEHKDTESLVNDLADSPYSGFITAEDFEKGLREFIYDRYDYFRKKMDDSAVLDIFMIKNDILNYMNFEKGIKEEDLYGQGVFKAGWWKEDRQPVFFRKVRERMSKMTRAKDKDVPDENIIEKVCVDIVNETYAGRIKSRFIEGYWSCTIDIKNLFINLYRRNSGIYLSGGSINENFWRDINIEEEIPLKLKAQPYADRLFAEEDRSKWDNITRTWLGRLIRKMRMVSFGPEPVVAYMLSILEEAFNLGMIRTGLNMGLENVRIKEGLSLAYI
ncbi:MAG: V-type ATPase subunit [Elusimicrobiota bacterium]